MVKRDMTTWLDRLEKRLGWLAIPGIALLLVTLQALGFFCVHLDDPQWVFRLALFPEAVKAGELWRVITFLALPITSSPLWMIFALMFTYFIVNSLESEWGAFKTTLYVLVSVLVTIAYSLTFDYAVLSAKHFESSLFLAAAALFPEFEVRLFFLVPAKLKWMAFLSGAFILYELATGTWLDRGYLLAIYSNFLLFFGPALLARAKQYARRKSYQRKLRE